MEGHNVQCAGSITQPRLRRRIDLGRGGLTREPNCTHAQLSCCPYAPYNIPFRRFFQANGKIGHRFARAEARRTKQGDGSRKRRLLFRCPLLGADTASIGYHPRRKIPLTDG